MTARISEGEWTPLEGAIPANLDADKVYLIPTRIAVQTRDLLSSLRKLDQTPLPFRYRLWEHLAFPYSGYSHRDDRPMRPTASGRANRS
jgi:hypothetical protein